MPWISKIQISRKMFKANRKDLKIFRDNMLSSFKNSHPDITMISYAYWSTRGDKHKNFVTLVLCNEKIDYVWANGIPREEIKKELEFLQHINTHLRLEYDTLGWENEDIEQDCFTIRLKVI